MSDSENISYAATLTDKDWSEYNPKWYPWRPRITDINTIIAYDYRGSGTESDPYRVVWLKEDAEDPKQYPGWYRWSVTLLAASMTLAVALASSAYSGAIEHIIIDFGCSEEVSIMGLSLMVLGYAMGPLLWGPLSEIYGRRYPFLISFVIYTMWMAVTCAAKNIGTVIVFRFFAGVFGSSSLVIPGGEIADMFPAEIRGLGIAVFCAAPFLGPSVGPLIGGFLGDSGGWKWVIGFLAIYAAILTALGAIFIPETYPPVLLRRRAAYLTKITGKKYLSTIDADNPQSISEIIKTALVRPWVLLIREPIVLIITIYMSCVYGTLYLCFAAFPIIFQQGRHWNAGIGGLAFMGVLVGLMIGIAVACWDNGRYVRLLRQTKNGYPPPECRLPPAIIGGAAIVVGLVWLAAADSPSIHWIVPILATVPFAFGIVLVFLCLGNYLVDSYVVFAASVFAGNGVMRSTFGAAFPLFTTYMFNNIGIHWGVAVPAFISAACFPFPILFYIYGPRIRKSCKYAAEAARILEEMTSGGRKQELEENEGVKEGEKTTMDVEST
ncbi:major facilitator superfamily domain-containing protein [Xylogone sp. PMI_703]|nr:major facilitator superfamily domain-containing protein [Xylogone sp. PMI_703]